MSEIASFNIEQDVSLVLHSPPSAPNTNLVRAAQSAVTTSDGQESDNTMDLDISNIAYINRIPIPPEGAKQGLDEMLQEILLWEAWELSKTEETLGSKLQEGKLPKDDSLDSKSKRTAYRRKVIEYLRRNSTWLGTTRYDNRTLDVTNTGGELSLDISHALQSLNPRPGAADLSLLMKAIGPSFGPANRVVQPFAFTLVDFIYDEAVRQYRTEVSLLAFDVQITQEASKPPKTSVGIVYTSHQANFNLDLWRLSKPSEENVTLGRELFKVKSLNSMLL